MESYVLEGILKNIEIYIEFIDGKISEDGYYILKGLYAKTKEEVKAEQREQEEKENIKKMKKLKQENFEHTYPKFKKMGLKYNIKRQELNALLFKQIAKDISFIKFQSAMKEYDMDELLEKLHSSFKEE